jgi:hypothetical protein
MTVGEQTKGSHFYFHLKFFNFVTNKKKVTFKTVISLKVKSLFFTEGGFKFKIHTQEETKKLSAFLERKMNPITVSST